MLHFANYEKHTEYDEEEKAWICSIYYDMADETELLIEVLSFGPVVQVLGPESFLRQIRARVKRRDDRITAGGVTLSPAPPRQLRFRFRIPLIFRPKQRPDLLAIIIPAVAQHQVQGDPKSAL